MKLLDKLISFLFSLVILVMAITVIMVSLEYVTPDRIYDILDEYIFAEDIKEITLITAFVVILAVLKVTIFNSNFKAKDKTPILVESKHGKVEISQDTIDNTVRSVVATFSEIKDVQAKMLKHKKGIKIYVLISVLVNTNIKQLTEKLQEEIERVIRETIGVNVLSTNIKVKNIYERNHKAREEKKVVAEPQAEKANEKAEEVELEKSENESNEKEAELSQEQTNENKSEE